MPTSQAILLPPKSHAAQRQIERVQRVRANRNARTVEEALRDLTDAAATPTANTMPSLIAAVEAHSTLGEICDTLRDVFGTYRP